jgi:ATP-dependent DNA ligase
LDVLADRRADRLLISRRPAPIDQRHGRAGQAPAGRQVAAKSPLALVEHLAGDGAVVFEHACALGCEGIVSKRLGSRYASGRSDAWRKVKNPAAPAVKREQEEDWSRRR